MGKILTSVFSIVLTLVMMGIGSYVHITGPKVHIDTTTALEIRKHQVPPNINSGNTSNHKLINSTILNPSENQNENNLSITNLEDLK